MELGVVRIASGLQCARVKTNSPEAPPFSPTLHLPLSSFPLCHQFHLENLQILMLLKTWLFPNFSFESCRPHLKLSSPVAFGLVRSPCNSDGTGMFLSSFSQQPLLLHCYSKCFCPSLNSCRPGSFHFHRHRALNGKQEVQSYETGRHIK